MWTKSIDLDDILLKTKIYDYKMSKQLFEIEGEKNI